MSHNFNSPPKTPDCLKHFFFFISPNCDQTGHNFLSYQVNIVLKKYWKHAELKEKGRLRRIILYNKILPCNKTLNAKQNKKITITCCTDEAGIQPNATHSKNEEKNIEH